MTQVESPATPPGQPAMIERIFLDLDGVLADWSSAAIRACGQDPDTVHSSWPLGAYELADVLGISTNEMWRRIHAQGARFWAELEPYPWLDSVFAACSTIAPTTILTSPSKDPSAAAGKTAWLQKHFGADFRKYLIGPDKVSCARPGAVLIDDSDKNCDGFAAARGSAIVFPRVWNSAFGALAGWREGARDIDIENRPARYVRQRLEVIRDA